MPWATWPWLKFSLSTDILGLFRTSLQIRLLDYFVWYMQYRKCFCSLVPLEDKAKVCRGFSSPPIIFHLLYLGIPPFFWQNAHLLIEHGIFGHLCGNAPNWYIITGKKIRNKILEVTAVLQVFNCFLSNNKSHHLNFKLLDLSFKRKAL